MKNIKNYIKVLFIVLNACIFTQSLMAQKDQNIEIGEQVNQIKTLKTIKMLCGLGSVVAGVASVVVFGHVALQIASNCRLTQYVCKKVGITGLMNICKINFLKQNKPLFAGEVALGSGLLLGAFGLRCGAMALLSKKIKVINDKSIEDKNIDDED